LKRLGLDDANFSFIHGKGCRACHSTGFKGRIGIYELLRMTPAVREAISTRSTEQVIRQAAIDTGMVPLLEAARDKIRQGVTTAEEVMRVIQWGDDGQASCPKCVKPVDIQAKKCELCKTKSKLVCQSCGQVLDPVWQVCPHCTAPILPVSGQVPVRIKPEYQRLGNFKKQSETLQ
jgi:hypothetical protein